MLLQKNIGLAGLGLTASHKRVILDGKAFDKYFPKPIATDPILNENGSVYDTVSYCGKIVNTTLDHTKRISALLKRNSLDETCRAIFNFFYKHYQYKMDKDGVEQVRNPARAWHDRVKGIDCDCFSISIGSILQNLNIPFYFRIVKLNKKSYFQHIYVIVPKFDKADLNKRANYYVIDPVLDKYDYEAPGITEKKDTKMSGIPIQYLNGVEENKLGHEFKNIGEHLMDRNLAVHMHKHGHKPHIDHYAKGEPLTIGNFHKDFLNRTKLHLINTRDHIAKHPHKYKHLYNPAVLKGHFDYALKHWDNDHTREAALDHLSNVEDQAYLPHLQGKSELLNGTDIQMFGVINGDDNLLGLGKKSHKKNGFFTKLKNVTQKVKESVKSGLKNAGQFAKKAVHTLVRYNPATLAIRGGLLLAFKTNFGRIASRLYWGYFPFSQAQKHGVSKAYWDRAVQAVAKVSGLFLNIGGTNEGMKKAIINGRAHAVINKFGAQGKFQGLGIVGAAATITAAGPVLGVIAGILKQIFGGKKKGTEIAENGSDVTPSTDPNSTDPGSGIVNDVTQMQSALRTAQSIVSPDDSSTSTPADNSAPAARKLNKTFDPSGNAASTSTDSGNTDDNSDTTTTPPASTKTPTSTTNADGSTTSTDANGKTTTAPAGSKTGLYVGLGIGALAIGAFALSKGKKKESAKAVSGLKKSEKKKVKVKVK